MSTIIQPSRPSNPAPRKDETSFAAEALRMGLVTRVTEPDDLLSEAFAMARLIIEAPQAALEAAKRYLISSASATFEEAFAVEHDKVFDDFLIGPAG